MRNEKKESKIKTFFKKYWGYIATFFVGIIASVGFIFSRLSGKPVKRSDELGDTLAELGDGLTSAGTEISGIRDGNADAINTVEQHRQTIDDIRDGHADITDSSSEIGKSISRLKELIEAERKRVEKGEVPE